ncbi:metal ABC transporter solute-binding protein, Zn/Mn family [Alicyclobacillus sp. SO9]|uniref:metal ABC transporter solute-binding protein, Zn/Mn family n=1 Tax=Alicyclobacillus sp. SO9 TaxID=2665646 RepID=UPI0018E7EDB1|nr:zinc ABC transporter substrate-binding protein [Alicyclobacillus sp. SO9]QQE78058.1 zinc ABC transporter substrate-binding protein [Alicyclobacillus sp. SO9]
MKRKTNSADKQGNLPRTARRANQAAIHGTQVRIKARRKLIQSTKLAAVTGTLAATLLGCNTEHASVGFGKTGMIEAVGAEAQYSNVIKAIGGKFVRVSTMINNPNVDPHDFQAGTNDAKKVAQATLVVQNGLGYDSFMTQLESATQNPKRTVIEAGTLVRGTAGKTNPHVWYKPGEMNKVATAVASALIKQDGAHKQVYEKNLSKFQTSMHTWQSQIQDLRKHYRNAPVAVTEPVADYLLHAGGLQIKTPWSFEAAVMNGIDPSPEAIRTEKNLLTKHLVKLLIYNPQATDTVSESLLKLARENHIPIVAAYETLPPGYDYASWMTAETKNIENALRTGQSTETMIK